MTGTARAGHAADAALARRRPPRAAAASRADFCPPHVATLKARAEFLRTARGDRAPCPGFLLQARARGEQGGLAHVGFTCSKKLGNAVTRNRAKRRLRAAARTVLPDRARPGWDYVLVGRRDATTARDFAALCADLARALDKLHKRGEAAR